MSKRSGDGGGWEHSALRRSALGAGAAPARDWSPSSSTRPTADPQSPQPRSRPRPATSKAPAASRSTPRQLLHLRLLPPHDRLLHLRRRLHRTAERVDPLDGPCGLALDSAGNLYVNNYHRNVRKFSPSFVPGPIIDAAQHPTGVAVDPATGDLYVNDRTYIASYQAPVESARNRSRKSASEASKTATASRSRAIRQQRAASTSPMPPPTRSRSMTRRRSPRPGRDDRRQRHPGRTSSPCATRRSPSTTPGASSTSPTTSSPPTPSARRRGLCLRLKRRLPRPPQVSASPTPCRRASRSTTPPARPRAASTSPRATRQIAAIFVYPPAAADYRDTGLQTPGASARRGDPASFGSRGERRECPGESVGANSGGSRSHKRGRRSASEVTQKGTLRVALGGKLAPRAAPEGAAPISVSVGWKLSTTDGTPGAETEDGADRDQPPRALRLDRPADLPLWPASSPPPPRALAACRSSWSAGHLRRRHRPQRPGALRDQRQAAGLQRQEQGQARPLRPDLLPPSLRHLLRDRLRGSGDR